MKYSILLILSICITSMLSGQDSYFRAEIQSQEVESGKVFKLDFIIKNMRGEFEAPDFAPFQLVGGPNQSSSIQIINGEYFQEYRYSYYLRADEPGFYVIPEATLILENDIVRTEPLEVQVIPAGSAPSPQKIKPPTPQPNSTDKLEEILKGKKVKKL